MSDEVYDQERDLEPVKEADTATQSIIAWGSSNVVVFMMLMTILVALFYLVDAPPLPDDVKAKIECAEQYKQVVDSGATELERAIAWDDYENCFDSVDDETTTNQPEPASLPSLDTGERVFSCLNPSSI